MAHQSLYRKYRPSTFDDVVGQQHIERTLRNAVAEGNVAHAYLFTGPRGTGKTTTARLLAKALLCERGPTDEPDGTCEQCVEIAEGRHPDVFELDAASRTGVDNVREEIIGRVQYAPSRGRYKVYIIDEVHMLSTAAFNALLKTLEEPPAHVIFVMCTTHPHKVPETIHSRCQRFDFRRMSVEEIADRLRFIAESEGFKIDRGAFTLLAKHADGGMRDAITTLEQVASFTGGEVTVDDVEGLLGEVNSAELFEVAGLIARRDIAGCFRWVAATVETGTDLAELVNELTGHVRDLYVVAAVGNATGIVDRTSDEMAQLQAQAAEFGGPDRLTRVLDLLGELGSEMRWSSDPRLSLEVALTRMARPQGEMTLEALAERVELLERRAVAAGGSAATAPAGISSQGARGVSTGSVDAPAISSQSARGVSTGGAGGDAPRESSSTAAASTESASMSDAAGSVNAASAAAQPPVPEPLEPSRPCPEPVVVAGKLDRGTAKRNWAAVLIEIKKLKASRASTFSQVEVDVDADGETLVIEFPEDQPFSVQLAEESETRDVVKSALTTVYGVAPPFRYQLGRGAVRPQESPPKQVVEPRPVEPQVEEAEAWPEEQARVSEEGVSTAVPQEEPAVAQPVAASEPSSALEEILLNTLGANIVSERIVNQENEPDGEAGTDEEEAITISDEQTSFMDEGEPLFVDDDTDDEEI